MRSTPSSGRWPRKPSRFRRGRASFGRSWRRRRAEIDAALTEALAARTAEAAQLPTALSDRYETLRSRLKGTGAARLIGSRCDGCHLELSSVEVEKIRALPPGQVASCEQCGRILVPV